MVVTGAAAAYVGAAMVVIGAAMVTVPKAAIVGWYRGEFGQ